MSDYLEGAFADLFFNAASFTPPDPFFIGISDSAWNDDGTGGTEPTSGAYARQSVAANRFTAAADVSTGSQPRWESHTLDDVIFPASDATWLHTGTPTNHLGLWDSASGGNLLWQVPIDATFVPSGTVVTFPAGNIKFTLASSGPSAQVNRGPYTTIIQALLDHLFGTSGFSTFTRYAGLISSGSYNSLTGAYTELTYTGYARQAEPTWSRQQTSGGRLQVYNSTTVTWPNNTGSLFGGFNAPALFDASTAGNCLAQLEGIFFGLLTGNNVDAPTGALVLELF